MREAIGALLYEAALDDWVFVLPTELDSGFRTAFWLLSPSVRSGIFEDSKAICSLSWEISLL